MQRVTEANGVVVLCGKVETEEDLRGLLNEIRLAYRYGKEVQVFFGEPTKFNPPSVGVHLTFSTS